MMNPAPPPTQTLVPFPVGRVNSQTLISSVSMDTGASSAMLFHVIFSVKIYDIKAKVLSSPNSVELLMIWLDEEGSKVD